MVLDVDPAPIFADGNGTSTLELSNQFDIEQFSGDSWWDRANVGVLDPRSGSRVVVSPDEGRLYNASGPNGACIAARWPSSC